MSVTRWWDEHNFGTFQTKLGMVRFVGFKFYRSTIFTLFLIVLNYWNIPLKWDTLPHWTFIQKSFIHFFSFFIRNSLTIVINYYNFYQRSFCVDGGITLEVLVWTVNDCWAHQILSINTDYDLCVHLYTLEFCEKKVRIMVFSTFIQLCSLTDNNADARKSVACPNRTRKYQ